MFYIETIIKKIDPKIWKHGFYVFGIIIIVHLYMIVNFMPNYDSIDLLVSSNDILTSGRWSLKYLSLPSSWFNVHYAEGVLSIFYPTLSGIAVYKLLELKNTILSILAAIIIGIYPTVASTFTFMYTADGYFLGLLMGIIAIVLFFQSESIIAFILGGLLLGLSIGAYQANLSTVCAICGAAIFSRAAREESSIYIIKKCGKLLRGISLGCAIYGIGLKIRLTMNNAVLTTYQGINEVTIFHSPKWYLKRFSACYSNFLDVIFSQDTDNYPFFSNNDSNSLSVSLFVN